MRNEKYNVQSEIICIIDQRLWNTERSFSTRTDHINIFFFDLIVFDKIDFTLINLNLLWHVADYYLFIVVCLSILYISDRRLDSFKDHSKNPLYFLTILKIIKPFCIGGSLFIFYVSLAYVSNNEY